MSDLRTPEAAALLGRAAVTLRSWRRRGQGPPYHGVPGRGGAALYDRDELLKWKDEHDGRQGS